MINFFIKIKNFVSFFMCDFFHAGGTIKRDSFGRINWQCDTCGKWSNNPILIKNEVKLVDSIIVESYVKNQKN